VAAQAKGKGDAAREEVNGVAPRGGAPHPAIQQRAEPTGQQLPACLRTPLRVE
jgi:hypothetical protein